MELFTKRHYEAIAQTIREHRQFLRERQVSGTQIDGLVLDLANMFQRDNERFDKKKFLQDTKEA